MSQENPFALVALDLDGVLLVDGAVDPSLVEALHGLHRAGIHLTTASGRSLSEQKSLLDGHHMFHSLICDEGDLYLSRNGSYEPHGPWNRRRARRWKKAEPAARELAEGAIQHFEKRGTEIRWSAENMEPRGRHTLVFSEREAAESCRVWMVEQADPHLLRVIRNHVDVAIGSNLMGKEIALAGLANRLNVPADRVLAVGDSNNDAGMLAGPYGFLGGVPGNGEEDLRAAVAERGGIVVKEPHPRGTLDILQDAFPDVLGE